MNKNLIQESGVMEEEDLGRLDFLDRIPFVKCLEHPKIDLNMLCIEKDCQNKGPICVRCMYQTHYKKHSVRSFLPLQELIQVCTDTISQDNSSNPIVDQMKTKISDLKFQVQQFVKSVTIWGQLLEKDLDNQFLETLKLQKNHLGELGNFLSFIKGGGSKIVSMDQTNKMRGYLYNLSHMVSFIDQEQSPVQSEKKQNKDVFEIDENFRLSTHKIHIKELDNYNQQCINGFIGKQEKVTQQIKYIQGLLADIQQVMECVNIQFNKDKFCMQGKSNYKDKVEKWIEDISNNQNSQNLYQSRIFEESSSEILEPLQIPYKIYVNELKPVDLIEIYKFKKALRQDGNNKFTKLALHQLILQAKQIKAKHICLGFSTATEENLSNSDLNKIPLTISAIDTVANAFKIKSLNQQDNQINKESSIFWFLDFQKGWGFANTKIEDFEIIQEENCDSLDGENSLLLNSIKEEEGAQQMNLTQSQKSLKVFYSEDMMDPDKDKTMILPFDSQIDQQSKLIVYKWVFLR